MNTLEDDLSTLNYANTKARIEKVIKDSGAMKPLAFASFYAGLLQGRPLNTFFEIGIHKGGSIRMWRDLIGPDATLACIDIRPEACDLARGVADKVYCGSQVDDNLLSEIAIDCGGFDVVIDDGSHANAHMVHSLQRLFPHVRSGGVYIIEDMFTSLWPSYGGGLLLKTSLLEYVKQAMDGLFADFVSPKYEKQFKGAQSPVLYQFPELTGLKQIVVDKAGLVGLIKE